MNQTSSDGNTRYALEYVMSVLMLGPLCPGSKFGGDVYLGTEAVRHKADARTMPACPVTAVTIANFR